MDMLNLSPQEVRLRVLEMARHMLHDAYVDEKAQRHNEWCARAEVAWKTQGVRIPYPGFPDYFTEQDVVQKAQVLLQFVFSTHATQMPSAPTLPDPATAPDLAPEPEQSVDLNEIMDSSPVEQIPEPESTPVPAHEEPASHTPSPEQQPEAEPVRKTLRILPNWRSKAQ